MISHKNTAEPVKLEKSNIFSSHSEWIGDIWYYKYQVIPTEYINFKMLKLFLYHFIKAEFVFKRENCPSVFKWSSVSCWCLFSVSDQVFWLFPCDSSTKSLKKEIITRVDECFWGVFKTWQYLLQKAKDFNFQDINETSHMEQEQHTSKCFYPFRRVWQIHIKHKHISQPSFISQTLLSTLHHKHTGRNLDAPWHWEWPKSTEWLRYKRVTNHQTCFQQQVTSSYKPTGGVTSSS